MTHTSRAYGYMPGFYSPKRPSTAQLIDRYARNWEAQRMELKKKAEKAVETPIPPTISISRKIGVGALEISDILGKKINHRVVDRDIIEQIAQESNLSQATVGMFDERYPGWREEFDLVINRDFFSEAEWVAAVIESAFRQKFGQ